MIRSFGLLTVGAVVLGLSSAVAVLRPVEVDARTARTGNVQRQIPAGLGHATLAPIAQAIPVSLHMPDPTMFPLLGAGAMLLMRRRRT